MRIWIPVLFAALALAAFSPVPPARAAGKTAVKKNAGGYGEAHKWFSRAARQGHKNAQYMLGLLYYNGRGIKRGYADARKWFTRAAKQNHTGAQYMLGIIHYDGKGVSKNLARAAAWFGKAAAKGDKDAQYMIGLIHYERAKGGGAAKN